MRMRQGWHAHVERAASNNCRTNHFFPAERTLGNRSESRLRLDCPSTLLGVDMKRSPFAVTLFLGFCLLLGAPRLASAHPGVGIVRDRQGNVFYTDLLHVWRISPTGQTTIAVRDVHTHELSIDSLGNVYGEDNRYLGSGEGDDRSRHRIWRRAPDGKVTDVIPWTAGFWRDYGFTRDAAGTMYWTRCPARRCTILSQARDGGRARTILTPDRLPNSINWIAGGMDAGTLFIIDGPALRRLDQAGRLTTVAANVGTQLMGLWPGADGRDVYVAAWGARAVMRVRLADGRVTTGARSPAPWAPSGVTVAPDGTLWVLEYSTSNAARVRRITADGRVRVFHGRNHTM